MQLLARSIVLCASLSFFATPVDCWGWGWGYDDDDDWSAPPPPPPYVPPPPPPTTTVTTTTPTTTSRTTTTGTFTTTTTSLTTVTATKTTTTTSTTTTATTTTQTTSTTTTLLLPGTECSSNSECLSSTCRTHCCSGSNDAGSGDGDGSDDDDDDAGTGVNPCQNSCGNDGSCYPPLAMKKGSFSPKAHKSWAPTYNKDEKADLLVELPPTDFVSSRTKSGKFKYRLMWRSDATAEDPPLSHTAEADDDLYSTSYPNGNNRPPAGLVPAGEGSDPGLFDVDSRTGTISALPRRNGDFSLYLLVVDTAGTASDLGLPAELDQILITRWDFSVVGKPDFIVTSYARKSANDLPTVSSGEDPFITRTTVGSIDCTVGTMYHIAPIDSNKLDYRHASGGDQAKIRFTIRNPPPGFFIEPSTGEVQGNPQAASAGQSFTSTLLAVDPAGQEAELEKISIAIHPLPRFVPVFEKERTAVAAVADADAAGPSADGFTSDYVDPRSSKQTFVVGTNYKIATFTLNKALTKVSAGSVDDISYTLSADAPESFCVKARSGDISGAFSTPGNHSFSVLAVDQAGETAVAERIMIHVHERPVFNISVDMSSRVRTGAEYSIPSEANAFYVNESYRFSPLQLIENSTTVSSGTFQDITYTLDSDDGWFVSAQTGEIFGQFGSAGWQNMSLWAVDSAGKRALVEFTHFDVTERPVFGLALDVDPSAFSKQQVGLSTSRQSFGGGSRGSYNAGSGDSSDKDGGSGYGSDDDDDFVAALVQYAIGSTVKFPPMNVAASELFVNPAFDDFSRITFKRTFGDATDGKNAAAAAAASASNGNNAAAATTPGLWLVDTETAEMLAQPETPGNYTVNLVATDGVGAEVVFRSWSFEVLRKDTDVLEYGPHGKDCANGGSRVDNAGIIFDRQYQCSCDGTGFVGANCDVLFECRSNEALVDGVCKPFELATTGDGARTADGPHFTNPTFMENKFYTVREFASYRIAPLAIDAARTNYSSGNQSDVTYTMAGDTDGFFLNTKTGQMLGTFDNFAGKDNDGAAAGAAAAAADKSATKQFVITLQAIDSNAVHQDLETIVMNVRYPDLEVDAYGPNGKPCENNGTRLDGLDGDGDPFDQAYVCKCTADGTGTSYAGDNCEVAVARSSAEVTGNTPVVAGSMAGAVVFLFCVGMILYKRRMYKIKMKAFDFKAEIERLVVAGELDENGEDGSELGSRIPREIKRSHITMIEQIGEGAFGEVWCGVLDESSAGGVPGYKTAIKTSKESKGEGAAEMLREATVMAQVSGHPNLVSLVGVVTSGVPLLLVISMCEHGSLLSLLKERKLKGKAERKLAFTLAERIGFGIDIAKGMAHLTANSFVHRDLAARNVLVDALMNCKVADFGLARGIAGARAGPDRNEDGDEEEYYRSRTGTFPVRWTSPEAMQTMRFSEASDVWSYGITLVEIFTDGGKPYAGMSNAAVISQVQGGYRAEQPKLCSDDVYAIMLKCWAAKSAARPTFAALTTQLEGVHGKCTVAASDSDTGSDTGSASSGASAAAITAAANHGIAVNDTYQADEPAAATAENSGGDMYLTVNNDVDVDGGDDADVVDEEYLAVASGLHTYDNATPSGATQDAADEDEFEC